MILDQGFIRQVVSRVMRKFVLQTLSTRRIGISLLGISFFLLSVFLLNYSVKLRFERS